MVGCGYLCMFAKVETGGRCTTWDTSRKAVEVGLSELQRKHQWESSMAMGLMGEKRYSELGTICCKKLKLYILKNHHDVEVSSWEAFSLRSPATKLAILCFASWFFCFGVAAFVQIFCQESNVQPVQLPVVCFVGIKFLGKFWCHCDLDNVGCAARTDEDLWRHPWCRPKPCFSEFDPFLGVTTSVVSTIPFHTKNRTKGQYFDMLELFNIGGEIPVTWTIKLPMYSLRMFPKNRGEVYGTRHEGEELHFHGRFCGPRSAISKSWGIQIDIWQNHWKWSLDLTKSGYNSVETFELLMLLKLRYPVPTLASLAGSCVT